MQVFAGDFDIRREISSEPGPYMSAKLLTIGTFALFLLVSLPSRAAQIDTEHLFAFTIGTDTGELGEKEIEGQTDGRLGKRDGSYTALSQVLSAEFNPVQNFRLEVSGTSIYHDISGVSGLDDRRRGGWQSMRAGFAAEKFGCVRRGALQYLHGRKPGFFHQLKFAKKSRAMNRADVSGVSACGDRDARIFQSFQIRQRDFVSLLDFIEGSFWIG